MREHLLSMQRDFAKKQSVADSLADLDKINELVLDSVVFEKPTFPSLALANYLVNKDFS